MSSKGRLTTCKKCEIKFKVTDKDEWSKNQKKCPSCGYLYCNTPKTESLLLSIQDKYFESGRDTKYLGMLYEILVEYAKSFLKKYKGGVTDLTYGKLEYYAHNAVTYIIEAYQTRKDFSIKFSFGGYLLKRINQALYCKEERLIPAESLDFKYEDGNFIEKEDDRYNGLLATIDSYQYKKDIVDSLCDAIKDVGQHCLNPQEDYIRILILNNYFRLGEKAIVKFFSVYPKDKGKYMILKTTEYLRHILHQMRMTNN